MIQKKCANTCKQHVTLDSLDNFETLKHQEEIIEYGPSLVMRYLPAHIARHLDSRFKIYRFPAHVNH